MQLKKASVNVRGHVSSRRGVRDHVRGVRSSVTAISEQKNLKVRKSALLIKTNWNFRKKCLFPTSELAATLGPTTDFKEESNWQ